MYSRIFIISIIICVCLLFSWILARSYTFKKELNNLKESVLLRSKQEFVRIPIKLKSTFNPETLQDFVEVSKSYCKQAINRGDFGKPNSKTRDISHYALEGGKHYRGAILLFIADCLNQSDCVKQTAAELCVGVESLQTASIIIDDLPEFDGSKERRNRPSLWMKEGKQATQLTAFLLSNQLSKSIMYQTELWRQESYNNSNLGFISRHSNMLTLVHDTIEYMISGQLEEVNKIGKRITTEDAYKIAREKTASLFELTFALGWLTSSPSAEKLNSYDENSMKEFNWIKKAGRAFGIAYQLADDIRDEKEDREAIKNGKPQSNLSITLQKETAMTELSQNIEKCRLMLIKLKLYGKNKIWDELFDKLLLVNVE